ncbi:endonuclease/exonuclease/phosphatase family protein [Deltaproteobacteria bacterium IMCC39524]|nr:endonuclease/exonuclease/phosphatase family protein [Deltaproteobacteria bacterium IMCC39524]
MKNRIAGFYSLLLWCVAGILFSWYILHLTRGDHFLPVRLLTYITPWVTIAAILAALSAWFLQKFKLAATLSCLFLLLAYPYISQFIPRSVDPGPGPTLKVMTYSVMGRNHDYDAMARVFAEYQPDLAYFQEVGQGALEDKLTALSVHKKLYFVTTNNIGFIVSRYPIELEEEARPFSRFTLTLPQGAVSLWNVHTWKAIRSYDAQYGQIKALTEAVGKTSDPMIVAGDFNATEMSETYRMMAAHLKNTHAEAGFGFGFTFPTPARRMGSLFPFLRIDHIFYSQHFEAISSKVGENAGGSDHLPVIAELRLVDDRVE